MLDYEHERVIANIKTGARAWFGNLGRLGAIIPKTRRNKQPRQIKPIKRVLLPRVRDKIKAWQKTNFLIGSTLNGGTV